MVILLLLMIMLEYIVLISRKTSFVVSDSKMQTIELGEANPAHLTGTYTEGINRYNPELNNLTGLTSSGNAVSQGCLWKDTNHWSSFIRRFNNSLQKSDVASVTFSRNQSTPVNATHLPAFNISLNVTRRSFSIFIK